MVQKMSGDPSFTVSAIMLGLEILQGHGHDRLSCTMAGTTADFHHWQKTEVYATGCSFCLENKVSDRKTVKLPKLILETRGFRFIAMEIRVSEKLVYPRQSHK